MTLRPSYARFYASKWRSGTLMLSLEEEGLYIRVSAYQMECGQPISSDWKVGARLLCVQPLKYRKIVDSLIAKGKLSQTEDGIICERAMAEYQRASKATDSAKLEPITNPDTNPDTNPASNRGTMGVGAEKEQENQTDFRKRREEKKRDTEQAAPPEQEPARPAPCVAALPASPLLVDRLIEACNGSLDNPVNCLGLLSPATPQMWLARGADLELDVIPTLQAAGKKYHGKRIRDWSYFTPMVADAVEKRKRGFPAVDVSQARQHPKVAGIANARAVLERMQAAAEVTA